MRITIDVEDDWLDKVECAAGEDGSNDDEHDLLMGIADDVRRAAPEHVYEVVVTSVYRTYGITGAHALTKVDDAIDSRPDGDTSSVTWVEDRDRSATRIEAEPAGPPAMHPGTPARTIVS